MPNWCSNTMTIAAKDRESLETILGRIGSKESPIDFEKIIPQEIFSPEYQFTGDHMNGELDERNPRFDWYRWRIDNWGTKWNACYASVWRDGDSCARFEFDTAWSPATPVFRKACRDVPRSVHLRRIRRGGHGLPRRVGTGRGRKLLRRLLRGFAGGIRPELSWILVYFRNRRKKYDFSAFRVPFEGKMTILRICRV